LKKKSHQNLGSQSIPAQSLYHLGRQNRISLHFFSILSLNLSLKAIQKKLFLAKREDNFQFFGKKPIYFWEKSEFLGKKNNFRGKNQIFIGKNLIFWG
jgi:hypothetical protein